jgi:uncharacterized membrane protein
VSSLIRQREHTPATIERRAAIFLGCVLMALLAFLLAPGDLAHKTHAALHGLCAQRPSHSLRMGDTLLPLDARMTGIYLGAAATFGWLALAGRLKWRKPLSRSVIITLGIFVLAMVVDGGNALLVDLGAPHPYAPSNLLRLITGGLVGTALGVALGHLFANSIWEQGARERAVVARPVELAIPLVCTAILGALALSGLPVLAAPYIVGLVLSAVAVFWALAAVLLALLCDRAWSYRRLGDLTPLALGALLAAVTTIAVLAGLRFAAERFLGLPTLT